MIQEQCLTKTYKIQNKPVIYQNHILQLLADLKSIQLVHASQHDLEFQMQSFALSYLEFNHKTFGCTDLKHYANIVCNPAEKTRIDMHAEQFV